MQFGLIETVSVVSVLSKHASEDKNKTAVIVGIAQGGTSMVAAVLDALGFSMNDEAHLYNFEMPSRPCPGDDEEAWFRKIGELNARGCNWGFKDPGIVRFDNAKVHAALQNPHYFVVAKDVVSIVQRRLQGKWPEIVPSHVLAEVIESESALWKWILGLQSANVLGVSYQRAVENRVAFVEGVVSFMDISPTPSQKDMAIRRISETGGYLMKED